MNKNYLHKEGVEMQNEFFVEERLVPKTLPPRSRRGKKIKKRKFRPVFLQILLSIFIFTILLTVFLYYHYSEFLS